MPKDSSNRIELLQGTLDIPLSGVIAALLAAIGLYGVMAFSVSRAVAGSPLKPAYGSVGYPGGCASALMLTSLVSKLLYGVKPNDPVSIGIWSASFGSHLEL